MVSGVRVAQALESVSPFLLMKYPSFDWFPHLIQTFISWMSTHTIHERLLDSVSFCSFYQTSQFFKRHFVLFEDVRFSTFSWMFLLTRLHLFIL